MAGVSDEEGASRCKVVSLPLNIYFTELVAM